MRKSPVPFDVALLVLVDMTWRSQTEALQMLARLREVFANQAPLRNHPDAERSVPQTTQPSDNTRNIPEPFRMVKNKSPGSPISPQNVGLLCRTPCLVN